MNKNSNFLFLGLTLLVLFVSIGAINAADMDDSTNNVISDNTADNSYDTLTTTSEKNIEVKSDVKSVNKNATTKKTIKTDKQTKKAVETIQTATNYETLKTSWDNIQNDGDNTTEYIINVKNGKYTFDEELKSNSSSNAKYITINGENWDQTIFDGTNTTRFFNLNNINQVIKFNNITFTNGFNNTMGGAIYVNSTAEFNNTKFINNTVFTNETGVNAYGGALGIFSNVNISNSVFNNNKAEDLDSYCYGGAIYTNTNIDIYNSSFTNNIAIDNTDNRKGSAFGGAIYIYGYETITNINLCEFINNTLKSPEGNGRKGYGGAIYNTGTGYVNLTSCNFIENKAICGGAIYIANTWGKESPDLKGCVFDKNNATSESNLYLGYNVDLNSSSNYYPDNSNTSDFFILVNGEATGQTFNQKTQNLTIACLIKTDSYMGHLLSLGRNYTLALKSSSDIINTTNVTFNQENKYMVTLNLSNLPANHENITLYVENIEVAKIVYEHNNVVFNNITAKPGSTITLKATFKTPTNQFIPNGKVAFKINGCTIGHSNIKYGTAILNYTIPENYSAKDYKLTVVYGGNNQFVSSRINSNLHLNKLATKTNLTTTIDGNTLKITVDPKDENGNTVKDGKICVKIEGKTLQTLKINGKTQVNFTIPKSWNNREIKVLAIYGENNNHKESRTEIKTKLTLPKTNIKEVKKDETINNYYVSANNGSDNNTGSQTSPFKTIQKAIDTVNSNKQNANIYLDGNFKGVGNTNLTVPGNLHINFIGVGNSSIDGEVNYTYKKYSELDSDEYYWGSSEIWHPYNNGTGNWAMNITKGNGLITISNLTIKNCWNPGGSDTASYITGTITNNGNLEIDNASFIFNHGGVGASIKNNPGANIKITNSLFEGNRKSNSTGNYGSGIYNNGTAIIINSTFQKNYARWGTVTNDKNMTIINSTIRDNIAYDGASTYKTGAGITINTASTDFYSNGTTENVITVIDGCTFTNNDQADIYIDKSQTDIKNNIFNKSTGVIVVSGSQKIVINIINNTFDSPIGSTFYTSLSSKNPLLIALKLSGNNTYNIDSNKVLNMIGTNSKALEMSASNSNITNNNFSRAIEAFGNNNIISGNTIITSMDAYTITIWTSKNNTITNNYLEATSFKGVSSISYTTSNITLANNKPEVKEIQVDDASFYKFFNDDGYLLDSYKDVEQIQLVGSLNNKNINLNHKVTLLPKSTFTSYNVTITTDSEIEILSVNIINTNNEPVIVLNANNCTIKSNTLRTDNEYAIIVNGENNTIESNTILASMYVGNEAVKTEKTNTIENNIPIYKNYILSQENFNTYFNEDGTIKPLDISEIHFIINGTIQNKDIILNNDKIVTITNYNNAKLINCTIKTLGETSLNMSYITIENTDKIPLQLNTPKNNITYSNITTNTTAINAINAENLKVSWNNITTKSNKEITTINIINTTTSTIDNNTITTVGLNKVVSINITNIISSGYCADNIITTQALNNNSEAISINLESNKTTESSSTGVASNTIITNATNATSVNTITGRKGNVRSNNIIPLGENPVGVKMQGILNKSAADVEYNTITLDDANSRGIIVEKFPYEIDVSYNTIYMNNNDSVGINISHIIKLSSDIYDFSNDYNTIKSTGSNNIAILYNNVTKFEITSQTIELLYNTNDTTAPIMLINSTQIPITKNKITTSSKYAIILDESSLYNKITDNTLYSQNLGNKAVLNPNMYNNYIMNNNPESTTYYTLNEETYNEYFNEDGTLKDIIPESITITVTGNLYNKILTINKPINLIADGITFTNTTITITPQAHDTNLTGMSLVGDSKVIINSNNTNIVLPSISVQNKDNNTQVVTLNGNNNMLDIKYFYSTGINDEKTDITLMKVMGENNTINMYSIEPSNYNKLTGILFENTNNTSLTIRNYFRLEELLENSTGILLKNSNNNTLDLDNLSLKSITESNGIIFTNSSYNTITSAGFWTSGYNTTSLKIENNSNFNMIKGLSSSSTSKTPIYITNSNNNTIRQSWLRYNSFIGYAINITEGMGNQVIYNHIETANLIGDDCVIQENKNESVNNRVMYNYASSLPTTRINMTLPNTAKVYDTIKINATVEYRNKSYIPSTNGHVIFTINNKEVAIVDVVDGYVELNYTIQPTDGKTLNVLLTYECPQLTSGIKQSTATINIEKLDTKIIMTNTTNNGITTTTTAIILDEKGNIVYDGNVTFTLDDQNKTVAIQNGIAQVTFDTSSYKPGKYNINATYNGNNVYKTINNTATLTVNKFDANIIIEPVNITAGKTSTLKATVTDANGNMLNSGRAVFKLNGCTLKDANGKTIYANVVDGIASINYTIPPSYTPKDYTLTAVASDNKYNRIEANTTLKVTKTTPKIQIPNTIKRTKNTQITINITDENGNKINSNQKVCLKFNGCTITNTKAINGTVNINLDLTKYKNPQYEITFICGENSQYTTSKLTSILNIE